MVLNINTGILVHFSVLEVIGNAQLHESLYKMKVFDHDANLLCFLFG